MSNVLKLCYYCLYAFNRSRPNQIAGPGPKSGPARKSESRGPENGVSKWRRPNSDIYSQNHHFGLVCGMIYQFLGMEAKNYKFGMFCQQCHPNAIHPWPQVMPIFDREMPPGFTPAICLRRNFVYISNLENRGDKSPNQNFKNIVFNRHADTAKLTGPRTFADKRWVGPVKLLCIIMFNISKIRSKSPFGPVKAQKFLQCLGMPTFGKNCRRPWLHGLKNQS